MKLTMAPFRYWGAKVRMAPWIIERIPAHEHFIESCAGSAAVMAAKPPSLFETVNDVYGEVVNFFRVLRSPDQCASLIDRVSFTPYARSEFLDAASPVDDPVDRAWGFFVRMQMAVVPGRSGWSYSVNGASARKANKPGRWATMPEHLKAMSRRFDRVQVTDWPILELLDRFDSAGVLHFVDPPYLEESRPKSMGASSAYVCDAFDHAAFVRAAQATKHADVLVVHYPHPMFDEGPWERIGDYESHKNIPNSETEVGGRSVAVERLYRLKR